MNKFGAKKVVLDGIAFDSLAESRRYADLKLLQEYAGEIRNLKVHPIYPLIVHECAFEKGLGDTLQSATLICNYEADFEYERNTVLSRWDPVTEDVKGMRTGGAWALFRLKAKLFEALYGRPVEVYPPAVKKPRRRKP